MFYSSSKVLNDELELTSFLVEIDVEEYIAIGLRILNGIHHDVESDLLKSQSVTNNV